LNLEQLWTRFSEESKIPDSLGRSRDYCVDLCPKFLMACGDLVKILLKTKVTTYLEFRSVAGSFVTEKLKLHRVPAKPSEAATTPLLSLFDKGRYKAFLKFVAEFDEDDEKTHNKFDISKMTAEDLFDKFKLKAKAQQFTGHAICLFLDDSYLSGPAMDLIKRAQLYANSVSRYGHSPYIYPKWGLGGLPEGFSRRSAVHGGVYMLNIDSKENFIEKIHYADGMVCGVQVGGEVAKCKMVVGDPTYWLGTDKVEQSGTVSRAICIMDHPIPETMDADSCQIIIPGADLGEGKERKTDIYVCMSSYQHNIAASGKYIAVCSAMSEAETAEGDLKPAIDLLGEVEKSFIWRSDYLIPKNDPKKDGCYITTSYDATTHFETCSRNVLELYTAIMGEPLDLEVPSETTEEEGTES